jgi:hypothetical protein
VKRLPHRSGPIINDSSPLSRSLLSPTKPSMTSQLLEADGAQSTPATSNTTVAESLQRDLIDACNNLRGLAFGTGDDMNTTSRPPQGPPACTARELEELLLLAWSHTDRVLASLHACTHVVILNIRGMLESVDYRLLCQAMKSSSPSIEVALDNRRNYGRPRFAQFITMFFWL